MNLKFTPQTVRAIENELKSPITRIISEVSVNAQLVMLKRGLHLKNDIEAESAMQEYFESADEENPKDMTTLHLEIVEALRDAHFLPQSVDMEDAKRSLK